MTTMKLTTAQQAFQSLRQQVSQQIIGQEILVERLLIALLADEQPPALPVHLLFEPSRAGLPAVRLFVEAMQARARTAGLG